MFHIGTHDCPVDKVVIQHQAILNLTEIGL
jgi:hypothetical protein